MAAECNASGRAGAARESGGGDDSEGRVRPETLFAANRGLGPGTWIEIALFRDKMGTVGLLMKSRFRENFEKNYPSSFDPPNGGSVVDRHGADRVQTGVRMQFTSGS